MTAKPEQTTSDSACGCILLVVILGVFIAIFFWACSACGGDGGGGDSGGSGQRYTLTDYHKIHVGMSRSEVKSILGGNGEPVPGYPEQRIYINDVDNSNIVVVYLGDVVMDKAQAGL